MSDSAGAGSSRGRGGSPSPLARFPSRFRRSEALDLTALQRRIAGTVVARGAAGYDAARLLYSPRFDGTLPLAVVYCQSATDVSRTILWARQNKVRIAARSGGHSYAGYSTTPGVVIDVSRLASITVNAAAGTAGIGAGARLMDVYRELAARGVTIPAGSCPSVGIAGLVLGGGVGFAGRKLGLTCDNLRSFTMVTADGVVRPCNPQRNPNLFWAGRGGGGGNFGIATRFTFTTHPVSTVTIFRAVWSWSDAARVVDAWQRWAPNAPDELFSLLSVEATDSGGTRLGSSGQFFGTSSQLQALLAPFFAAGATPVSLDVRTLPYLDAMLLWAGCSDALHCRLGDGVGRSTFAAKSDYVTTPLSSAGIDTLLRAIEARAAAPARASVLLDAYGGCDQPHPEGGDGVRSPRRVVLVPVHRRAGTRPAGDPAASAAISWLRNTHAAMRPHVSGLAYQNYIDAELPRWGIAYYGSNYARLRRVKRHYDPKNVFRFAQSIVPAPG